MKLPKINNLLLVLIILVNGYIVIAPLLPSLLFMARDRGGQRQQLTTIIHSRDSQSGSKSNRLVIPSMLLDQPVLEGPLITQYQTLNRGIWRWPPGSSPDKGGNTVLIGHRFTYTNPQGVFYHLDKVKPGDEIGLFWNSKKYLYKVSAVRTVDAHDTSIENSAEGSRLTLFTCTPLWLPKDRLVVVANLETRL